MLTEAQPICPLGNCQHGGGECDFQFLQDMRRRMVELEREVQELKSSEERFKSKRDHFRHCYFIIQLCHISLIIILQMGLFDARCTLELDLTGNCDFKCMVYLVHSKTNSRIFVLDFILAQ